MAKQDLSGDFTAVLSSLSLVSPAGGVCVLRVSRRAVPLAPPKPGAGTAALQRGAALGGHGDPAVSVAAKEDPAAPQVHQDRSAVSADRTLRQGDHAFPTAWYQLISNRHFMGSIL